MPEITRLKRDYPHTPIAEMAAAHGRSQIAIASAARRYGAKKTTIPFLSPLLMQAIASAGTVPTHKLVAQFWQYRRLHVYQSLAKLRIAGKIHQPRYRIWAMGPQIRPAVTVERMILAALAGGPMSYPDIVRAVDAKPKTIKRRMTFMRKKGVIENPRMGVWRLAEDCH